MATAFQCDSCQELTLKDFNGRSCSVSKGGAVFRVLNLRDSAGFLAHDPNLCARCFREYLREYAEKLS